MASELVSGPIDWAVADCFGGVHPAVVVSRPDAGLGLVAGLCFAQMVGLGLAMLQHRRTVAAVIAEPGNIA